jgi:hypothetical protein
LQRTLTISLDIDWLWRALLPRLEILALDLAAGARVLRQTVTTTALTCLGAMAKRLVAGNGLFARPWRIGTTALWTAVLLSVYILSYYV